MILTWEGQVIDSRACLVNNAPAPARRSHAGAPVQVALPPAPRGRDRRSWGLVMCALVPLTPSGQPTCGLQGGCTLAPPFNGPFPSNPWLQLVAAGA